MSIAVPTLVEPRIDSSSFFARLLTICRNLTISLIALLIVGALALTGRQWLESRAKALQVKPGPVPPAVVRVVSLQPEVVTASLKYSAEVKEVERAELSFRVGGTIESLYQVEAPGGRLHGIHEGDRVSLGTEIAKLDIADSLRDRGVAAQKLANAEAKLAQLESDSTLAKLEFRRAETLLKRNAGSVSDKDTAMAKQVSTAALAAAAHRDIDSAKISLAQADANLSYCSLKSPFKEGTVAERYVDAGERVAANQKAFLLLDLSSVVIAFGVPDTLVGRLYLGQEVDVVSDALPGERFKAVFHKIASLADARTRTYAVEVRIDEPKGLKPGMIATVRFRKEQTAFLLPLTAISPRSGSGAYDVYRVVEDKGRTVVRRVPVEFDDVLDNRVSARIGGDSLLKPGDRVVEIGTHRIYDGQPVQIEERGMVQ